MKRRKTKPNEYVDYRTGEPVKLTCDELLAIARREKPHVRYTRNRQGTAIAAWENGAWRTVAMVTVPSLGRWGAVGELWVNGEPANKPEDWLPE